MKMESLKPQICGWRTGPKHCLIAVLSGSHCAWHQHWLRVVGAGNVGRQQFEEFCEWWEQFQPYGQYAENHGPWWAAVDVLWAALTGVAAVPAMTTVIANELLLRRAEVRRFRQRLPWTGDPWPRMSDMPLPAWRPEHWQPKCSSSEEHFERRKERSCA